MNVEPGLPLKKMIKKQDLYLYQYRYEKKGIHLFFKNAFRKDKYYCSVLYGFDFDLHLLKPQE